MNTDSTGMTKSQCSSLTALFDHFAYPYGDLGSIDASPDFCCKIEGVTCTGDKIVSLELSGKDLRGRIPETINELKWLRNLNLSHNDINGPIPKLQLEALENLDVSGNNLSGDLSCSLLDSKSLISVTVDGNKELVGKVWLNTMSEVTGKYAPGTRVYLCEQNSSTSDCKIRPNCQIYQSTYSALSDFQSAVRSVGSDRVVIASVASVLFVAFIGLLGYLAFRRRKSEFEQFDPEIKSDKKDKVHRLSLFLSKKTKNPSQMESVA